MTERRRMLDVEIAVLSDKMSALSKSLVRHMEHEEEERKQIWKELRSLDKKFVIFSTAILATAGGPNVAQILQTLF